MENLPDNNLNLSRVDGLEASKGRVKKAEDQKKRVVTPLFGAMTGSVTINQSTNRLEAEIGRWEPFIG